jgi:hypothetical protein
VSLDDRLCDIANGAVTVVGVLLLLGIIGGFLALGSSRADRTSADACARLLGRAPEG